MPYKDKAKQRAASRRYYLRNRKRILREAKAKREAVDPELAMRRKERAAEATRKLKERQRHDRAYYKWHRHMRRRFYKWVCKEGTFSRCQRMPFEVLPDGGLFRIDWRTEEGYEQARRRTDCMADLVPSTLRWNASREIVFRSVRLPWAVSWGRVTFYPGFWPATGSRVWDAFEKHMLAGEERGRREMAASAARPLSDFTPTRATSRFFQSLRLGMDTPTCA